MARSSRRQKRHRDSAMVLQGRNYWLMLIGLALVVVGYVIMRMENEVEGFISLYVAPLMILGGYLEIIFAILWRPSQPAEPEEG